MEKYIDRLVIGISIIFIVGFCVAAIVVSIVYEKPSTPTVVEVSKNEVVLLENEQIIRTLDKSIFLEMLILDHVLPPGRGAKWISMNVIEIDGGQIQAYISPENCSGIYVTDIYYPNECFPASHFQYYIPNEEENG